MDFLKNQKVKLVAEKNTKIQTYTAAQISNSYTKLIKDLLNEGVFSSNTQIKKIINNITITYPHYTIDYLLPEMNDSVLHGIDVVARHQYHAELF